MDPNKHLRHTAYNDYAAQVRVNFFSEFDMSISNLLDQNIGPVIFREDTHFLKEVGLNESIKVDCCLAAMSRDAKKWHFFHQIFNDNRLIAATIKVEGAWLDLKKRRLASPPAKIGDIMTKEMPRTKDFFWL